MAQAKTQANNQDVIEFINNIAPLSKKEDTFKLLEFFEKASGYPAVMWGDSLIGFGRYHYKYKSNHEGDAPLVAFSPRKNYISLYFSTDQETRKRLLSRLGKHKAMVGCVQIKNLDDIDMDVLSEFIDQSIQFLQNLYPNT